MINTILIIIILYLLWVIFYLGKDRLWCCKKEVGQVREQPIRKPKKGSIMGATRTVISQTEPTEAKQSHDEPSANQVTIFAPQTESNHPAKVEQEEFDTVFSNTPMDIEVQAEYPQEEEEIEEEDISCIATGEAPPTAQGLDFDEMSNLIKVMRQKEDTPQELKMAVTTIDKVRDTELFNKMVSSIGGEGLARIEAMFAKNESQPKEPPATGGFDDFDFKSFLQAGNGNK